MRTVNIFDICSPKQWKTISTNELTEQGYPVYGANGIIGFFHQFTHEKPTLLITCRGATCGKINISVPFSYVNGNAMALDNLSKDVDMNYLSFFLNYRGFKDVISGSAQPQITKEGLNKIQIPLPPLSEQKRIADLLDTADQLRQKDKALLEKYDQLAQSLFLEMFGDPVKNEKGWEVKKGCEMFQFSSGKFNPTSNLNPTFKYPTYGGNGITGYSSNFLIDYSTLVIGRVGAYCGSIHLSDVKSWITDNAIYIKNFKIETDLVFCYFQFLNLKLNRFADFSGQPKITQKPLEEILYFSPPISLQNQFTEQVQLIEQQKELAKKNLEKSEELFGALMGEVFG